MLIVSFLIINQKAMRIYLHLSPNRELVPFNYQQSLVGAFHRWLGENELHDDISLYSLSWLSRGIPTKGGLNFPNGSTFFVSAPDPALLTALVQGMFKGQAIRWGMEVREASIQKTPSFGNKRRFLAQSPILIKRKLELEKHYQFYYPSDTQSNEFLTETMRRKLDKAGLSTDISVSFDTEYDRPIVKKIRYRGLDIKGTICPVIVEGDPRAVQFAWEVGVGNSTGIGFGALK